MTTRLIRCATLAATFAIALPVYGQTAARPMNPLATYPQRYALINRELPTYRTIAVNMESLGIENRSTDGGKVEASCKGSETRRIVAIDDGEHGSTTTNFYFWNNSLFFVQIQSQRSDELYGPTVESSDDRLYYLNGKLVKWLDGRNSPKAFNTRAARKTDQFVRTDAAAFFSHLAGCPTNLLSAAEADTTAPAMAPAAAYDTGMKMDAPPTQTLDDIRERAYVAAMKSDLRTLATYEEQFAADNNGAYFGGTATFGSLLHGFNPSNYVTINITKTGGARPNWSATATHAKSSKMCITSNGVINCD
jgi:hypothetical protein